MEAGKQNIKIAVTIKSIKNKNKKKTEEIWIKIKCSHTLSDSVVDDMEYKATKYIHTYYGDLKTFLNCGVILF